MSNTSRFFLRAAAVLLAILLPVGTAIGLLFGLGPVYTETFFGELPEKFDRLTSIEESKLVVIGGSSVAFGLNSETLSQYTGMPVVNFGLYATLGTKLMLDLSQANIREGDILLLAPEMDAQTLSLYFNAEAAWQALEGNWDMLRYVGESDRGALAGGAVDYLGAKLDYRINHKSPSPTGVYRRDSFNEYGDICYQRDVNVMTKGYDTNRPIALTEELFSEDFLEYLNAYIARAEKKGATVYFAFCPMNRDALAPDTTEESLRDFYQYVCRSVRCPVITGLDTAIMDAGYFYDTNFHLNDAGVTVHTAHLIEGLMRAEGKKDILTLSLPEPPEIPTQGGETDTPIGDEDPNAGYFTYTIYGKVAAISGTTEAARALSSLEIPRNAGGHPVLILEKDALVGCDKLTDLTVYENLTLMEDGCLNGCTSLRSLHIRRELADDLEVGEKLFDGAPADAQVLLYDDISYSNFTAGYWWGIHSGRMRQVQQ